MESVVGNMNQENVLLMEENVTSAVNLIIFLDIVQNNKQVHTVEEDDYVFVGVIKNQEIKVNNWQQKINVCDVPMNLKLDTGSDANMLSLNMLKLIQSMPEVSKSSITMCVYNGGCMPSIGEDKVTLSYKNNIIESTMQIIKQCRQPILSAINCENLNIIKRVNAVVTDSVANVRQKYPELFLGNGSLPGEHSFVLKEDVTPVIHATRRVAVAKREDLKTELDRQVKLGFIAKQDQPTDWVNSLVITEKKNGQIRLYIDPKDLNKAIKCEHFQLHTKEEILRKLTGARFFSKMDVTAGFHQIILDEKSSLMTTFNIPFGRYSRYLRLPMGICSAPEVFHKKCISAFRKPKRCGSIH